MPASRELTSEPVAVTHPPASRASVAAAWLATIGLLAVPLACAPDLVDRFRIIKESVLRAEAIVGLFLVIVAVAFGALPRVRELVRERALFAIAIAGLVWGAITTLTSTHRLHSIESLASIVAAIVLFLVVWFAATRVSLVAIDLLVLAAAINATLMTLQEYSIYQPFRVHPQMAAHLTATGLIGNPNIGGSYLALVAVILITAATAIRGLRRAWYIIGALFAIGGVLVSDTETAVVALAAGLGLLMIGRSWKRAIALAVVAATIFGIGVAMRIPVIVDLLALPQRISQHGLEVALSGRVAPAIIALRETRAHPLTGIGPGTYGYHFMPERTRLTVESGYPIGLGLNFGEVHNDHLQILAEGGVPAYLLFLGAVVAVLAAARRGDGTSDRARFVRMLAIPLAGAFLVLCLAQFPLQVAITRHLILTMGALIAGWSRT
ncbi:MAG TPA: O-antigen ligase family protein [Thermoanaerobaculia bacterium]|nr:O-antigen ligase family protein [Thermoanaerobaculia bacterium]